MSCPKRRYATQVDAMMALALIKRKDRPSADEKRWYYCYFCRGFHLTSHDRRQSR